MLTTKADEARALARQNLAIYLTLTNYTNNWLRCGFDPDDLEHGGSDRLVDAVVAWGDVDAIATRIREHPDAGADHVCVQVLTPGATTFPRTEWRGLATALSR